jgi:NADPH2:quinone reductase
MPQIGAEDVLIQVAYSGVGGTDFAQRKGNFNPKPGSPPHHLIMGLEVSGLVAKVGERVTDFREGDRVCALLYGGGYSEYAVAPTQQVLELPDCLTLAEGACVPENFWTVWANLFEPAFGNLLERPTEKTLLVHGGAGGIGSTALTLASAFGVRTITTVSSTAKAEAAKRFGADVAIDYTQRDFVEGVMEATGGHGADVVLCYLGGDYMPRNVAALAKHGRLVQLGLRRGKDVTFDFKALMNKWGVVTGGHLRPRTLAQKHATRDALREHVLPRWREGTLPKPEVMLTMPLAEAGRAHAMLEEGKIIGKVLLEP